MMVKKKDLEIKKEESFSEGITRLLVELHQESARLVITKSRRHKAIHELRKNIKKIRGILRLIRHEIGNKKYHELNNYYKSIANEVAIVRDDTSQIELLVNLKSRARNARLRYIFSKAIVQVQKNRKTELDNFIKASKPFFIQQFLLKQKNKIGELNFRGDPELFILKSLKRIHRRSRSAYELSGELKHDEIYHNWRKQLKYLMYQILILNKNDNAYLNNYISGLDELNRLLGTLHDLDLLRSHINENKLIVLKPDQKNALLKSIYQNKYSLKKKIEKTGLKVFEESSDEFAEKVYETWRNFQGCRPSMRVDIPDYHC